MAKYKLTKKTDANGTLQDILIDYETGVDNKPSKKSIETTKSTLNIKGSKTKTWSGLTSFYSYYIWTDGKEIYYSNGSQQYVLNKATSTWETKTWMGINTSTELPYFRGDFIWTDGTNIYFSRDNIQKVLGSSQWSAKTWNGEKKPSGDCIWTDGKTIYHSGGTTDQWELNIDTSTWTAKTWNGGTIGGSSAIWTDGKDIYWSNTNGTNDLHYVLDLETSTWKEKTFIGRTHFFGGNVWHYNLNTYLYDYYGGGNLYKYNIDTSAWEITDISFRLGNEGIWSDGSHYYYSSGSTHYELNLAEITTTKTKLGKLNQDLSSYAKTSDVNTSLNNKQDKTDSNLQTSSTTVVGAINEVNSLAKQSNKAKGFTSYSALITELNSAASTAYNVGQSFYIQTLDVPDLWVISVESSSSSYTYSTDAAFITATGASGGQQVGYYKLAQLETQKVDLTNYSQKSETVSDVSYDSTNKKLQKTINGTTSDVVTFGSNAFNSTTIPTTYVSTVNGDSGAITNVAKNNVDNNFPHTTFSGSLEIFSDGSNWSEGIRIHSASNGWDGIVLCDSTNTGSIGTGANTWSMHNYNGTFGIYRNGSNTSATSYLSNVNGNWQMSNNLTMNNGSITIGGGATLSYDSTNKCLKVTF